MIEFDTETTGLQPWSENVEGFLWIFSSEPNGADAEAITYWPGDGSPEGLEARARIQAWLDRGAEEGIRAWNTKFDRSFADSAGFNCPPDGCWHDGMLVAHIMDERRSVALKSVAASLLGDEAAAPQKALKDWLNADNRRRQKEARDSGGEEYERANYSHVPMEIMEPYAIEDVVLTRKISDIYGARLAQMPDLMKTYEFERQAMDALFAIEKRGLPAKQTEYRKLEQEVLDNLVVLEARIAELAAEADPVIYAKALAGDKWSEKGGHWVEVSENGQEVLYRGGAAHVKDFNSKSSQQILAMLKARKADMSYMSEKDGKVSADAENLRAVDDALAAAILEFRSEFKVLSTYVRPMIGRSYVSSMNTYKEPFIAEDSRIHATYRQVGARTGRMSCIAQGSYVDAPRDLVKHPRGIKIEDVVEGQHVYSFDAQGIPRARRVTKVMAQGTKPVLRLVWRAAGNKSYLGDLRATPDHLVRLRSGGYKRMDELQPGDKLAFLSRQVTGDGYARICWKHGSGDGKSSSVDEHQHLGAGEVVHHVNEEKLDNSVSNLVAMSRVEHSRLHALAQKRPLKTCPYSQAEFASIVSGGIKRATSSGHDITTLRRWAAELEVSVPDRRRRSLEPTNHVVVAVVDDGEVVPTFDLSIEGTPNFVVNEIGVHNCADPNMQNQPRDDLRLRYNIVADPGFSLITCDLSNIEMVLFAAYCGEGRLLQAVKAQEDLHVLTAKMLGLRDRARPGGGVETARQLGKGAPLDTPLLTPNGWTTYGEISVGDFVVGSNGKPTAVTGVFPRGVLPTSKVTFSDGTTAVVDNEHLWAVRTPSQASRNADWSVKSTAELSLEQHKEWRIPIVKPVEFANQADLPFDPYMLGIMLGDGCFRSGYPSFASEDSEIIDYARELAQGAGLSLKKNGKCSYRAVGQHKVTNPWTSAFRVLGLDGKYSYEKHIPEEYLRASVADRLALLQGLMDSDGYLVGTAGAEITLTSKRLTDGIVELTRSLGGVARSRERECFLYGVQHQNAHRTRVWLPSEMQPFRLTRKLTQPFERTSIQRNITKIESDVPQEIVCISVAAEDSLYVSSDYLVTHNTYNFSRIYGGGLRTIKRSFRCSMDDARLLKRRFDDAYPEVSRLQTRIEYSLHDNGYIQDKLISGRRFRVDPRDAYKATNYLVQGTAASILKDAVINLHKDGVPMVALVHDEIVAHVPTSEAPDIAKLIEQRMTELPQLKGVVPLSAEADIVQRWSDAKTLKDEDGREYYFDPQWAKTKRRYVA